MIASEWRNCFPLVMQFGFLLKPTHEPTIGHCLSIGSQQVPMIFVRHRRARRYVLRLRADGVARVTVPRGGSQLEAWRFAERNLPWLIRQLQKLAARSTTRQQWVIGTEILLWGEAVKIEAGTNDEPGVVRIGTETIRVNDSAADLRKPIERHLWKLAAKEFPPLVFELAAKHGLRAQRVTVRNQRSRWGSCSRRGTISLNWRLIQAPQSVRDYLILHELAHLREMNHSSRFWRAVEQLCPNYKTAERWLKVHGSSLLDRGF